MKTETIPVLIAGAGPTGLTMANLLARFDIPFLLIDKNSHPSIDSKAFAIHARTLEIFGQLGLAEKAIWEGNEDIAFHFFIKGEEAVKFQFGKALYGETNYPYLLILPQDKTENILINSLEELDRKVWWEHELVKFEEHDGEFLATVKGPSGEEKIKIRYLLGCDGVGSSVREQGGFSFEGKTFSSVFYLADCELEWKYPHGDVFFLLDHLHLSGIFPYREKNKYRLFNFMNTFLAKNDGELSLEEVQKILDSSQNNKIKVKNVNWSSVFQIHSRIANEFRKGRVFLLGDAAHVHTPAGGQGMNTGIQDAYNLAWKLSLILKGNANAKLLDTYQEERYLIAVNLHKTTDRFFHWMINPHPIADFFRLNILPLLFRLIMGKKFFRKKIQRRASQIAIKYPHSSINKEGNSKKFCKNAPKVGDRAPYARIILDGKESDVFQLFKCTHFTMLIAVSDTEVQRADNIAEHFNRHSSLPLNVHIIPVGSDNDSFFKIYGVKRDALFIIRPDGHISFRSSVLNLKEVKNYFKGNIEKEV